MYYSMSPVTVNAGGRFDLGAGPENMIDFRAGRDVLVDDLVERYPHEKAGIKAYMAAVKRSAVGTNALMLSKV